MQRAVMTLLALPVAAGLAYWRLVKDAAGEPGVRCGICGRKPEPGERRCHDCQMANMSAP